ncbi:MAG: ATP cone domain-containing protein [Archaeoglobaceae archaeon]|nr:ATP cone domain-containing protein [Archaeoglobaceae archaeon]
MKVMKRDGRFEEFNREKIIKSAKRAGLSDDKAQKIVEIVEKRIYDGISTEEILKIVLEEIEKLSKKVYMKYSLKSSLLRLGPEGYRFEKFVSALLKEYGYRTRLNELIRGKCVVHEIDIIAEKEKKFIVECKFHNTPSYTGIKEILYSYARFLDILEANEFYEAWIFTNTKFSSEAIRFAECRGIKLTGWRYPEGEGIEFLLENKRLYPITILKLNNFEIEELLKSGFAFCNDIIKNEEKIIEIFGRRGIEIAKEAEIVVK